MPRLRYLIGNHVGRGEVRHDHGTWGRSVLPLSPGERSWVARSVPWILFFFLLFFSLSISMVLVLFFLINGFSWFLGRPFLS